MAGSSDAAGVVEAAGACPGSPAKSGGQFIPTAKDKERRTMRRWRRTIIGRGWRQRLASTRPDGNGNRHVHSGKRGRPSGKTSKTAIKTTDNELSRESSAAEWQSFQVSDFIGLFDPFPQLSGPHTVSPHPGSSQPVVERNRLKWLRFFPDRFLFPSFNYAQGQKLEAGTKPWESKYQEIFYSNVGKE